MRIEIQKHIVDWLQVWKLTEIQNLELKAVHVEHAEIAGEDDQHIQPFSTPDNQ